MTGLWLKNLPLLQPTTIVGGRKPRVHWAAPGPNRWMERKSHVLGRGAGDGRTVGRPGVNTNPLEDDPGACCTCGANSLR
jgi:hypothetical protein